MHKQINPLFAKSNWPFASLVSMQLGCSYDHSSPASLPSCCDWHQQESVKVAYVSWTAVEIAARCQLELRFLVTASTV